MLDDRFLRVRGTLRTDKIHLGSGNILAADDRIEDRTITSQINAG